VLRQVLLTRELLLDVTNLKMESGSCHSQKQLL